MKNVQMILNVPDGAGGMYIAGSNLELDDNLATALVARGAAAYISSTANAQKVPTDVLSRTSATSRLVGGVGTTLGNVSNWTNYFKIEAEAPFSALRLKIHSRETAVSNVYKFVAAATSTAGQGSSAQLFDPTQDGVTFSTVLAAAGVFGWRAGTWGGAATVDVPGGASMLPSDSGWSDWVPCASVPRTDVPGLGRHLAMLRTYHDGTTQPFTYVNGIWQLSQWNSQTAKDYYRVYQVGITSAADNVATLTAKPGSLGGSSIWISVEFAYNVERARSLIGIGDSIMEANATQLPSNGLGAYGMRGCARASTPTRPISWINGGYSAQSSAVYFPAGMAAITGLNPTDVLYSAGSPNDGAADRFYSDAMMARTQQVIDKCRAERRLVFLPTVVPNETWTLAQDNERKRFNDMVRNLCSTGAAILVDYDGAVSNGASPARFLAGMKFDTIHPSDAAMDLGGDLLRDALLATWG